MHNVLHLRKRSFLDPWKTTSLVRGRRGYAEDLTSCRAASQEKRGREAKVKSAALTRRQNGVIAGRGCREKLEVGYEGVTTRRVLEVLMFANVFKYY